MSPVVLVLILFLVLGNKSSSSTPPVYPPNRPPPGTSPPFYPPTYYPGQNPVGDAANAALAAISKWASSPGGGTGTFGNTGASSIPGYNPYGTYAPGASRPGPFAPQASTSYGDGLATPNFDAATSSDVVSYSDAGGDTSYV